MALGGRETWARDRRIVSMLRVFHFKSVRVELGGRVEILVRSMMKRHESSCMDEDARMKIDVAGGELLGNMARTEEKKNKRLFASWEVARKMRPPHADLFSS